MKILTLFTVYVIALSSTAWSQDSQYAGDALQLGAGARALGLGSAFVAISDDATAFFWNPGGYAILPKRELHAQHTEQFGGSINHDIIAIGFPLKRAGIGLGLVRLGVDGISFTQLENPNRPLGPDNRPQISQTVGTTDNVLYLSYAHKLKPGFSLGISSKFIHRALHVGKGTGFGLDTGILYHPSGALKFGVVIRNITQTRIHFDTNTTDAISPSLLVGTSYLHKFSQRHQILGSASLHLGEDTSGIEKNQIFNMGLEYQFKQRLMFRLGRQGTHLTAGAGLKLSRATIDLAFLENNQLNNTYRISTSIYF